MIVTSRLFVNDALKISVAIGIDLMTPPYFGSMLAVEIELRDAQGQLHNSPAALAVNVHSLDSDSVPSASAVLEASALPVELENVRKAGNYIAYLDTSKLAGAGRYLLRTYAPYSGGKVLAQEVFTLANPATIE